MINKEQEYYANLRIVLQEIIENLRHYSYIITGIAAILIPTTSFGFTIKIEGNERFVLFSGIFSIFILVIFWLITFTSITRGINKMRTYGQNIENELNKNSTNSGETIRFFDLTLHPRLNYTSFLFVLSVCICLLWFFYILDKNLL